MTRKELFKQVNELCKKLDCDYNINSGGCCFVAAVLAECLEKVSIPYKAFQYYNPCHYVIKVSDRYLNRGNFTNYKVEIKDCSSISLYNIYKENDWCDYYSRKNNLIVKTKIQSLFRKYEN